MAHPNMNSALVLLVDAGNTRIKFGWLDLHTGAREPTPFALTHDALHELAPWLAALPAPPLRIAGVNVAGEHTRHAIEAALADQQRPVEWLYSTAFQAGIHNLYDEPGRLGTDRWASLIGLATHTPGPALLATFGTATTIDTLGPLVPCGSSSGAPAKLERHFEGGLILPGPELMRRSLNQATAGLPYAEGSSVAFPRHTHAAISSGIAAAQAGAVVRQWCCAYDRFGGEPAVYCSGGGWPLVREEVEAGLARAQADRGLACTPPHWLASPVLDGLATLMRTGA